MHSSTIRAPESFTACVSFSGLFVLRRVATVTAFLVFARLAFGFTSPSRRLAFGFTSPSSRLAFGFASLLGRGSLISAWAAASHATGTMYGEHET